MKTVYIPKGETASYESLVTEHLVVNGCLKTAYGIKAKSISGSGVICAGSVEADDICLDDIEATYIACKRLLAKRVKTPELFASESVAVSCFISSAYVETGRLTAAISEISEIKANEIINLTPKERSLFVTLLLSALRSLWTMLSSPSKVTDADYTVLSDDSNNTEVRDSKTAEKDENKPEQPAKVEDDSTDEELNRFIQTFRLLRDSGYTLKVVPGAPEENAPIFDFEKQCIVQPAA